MAAQSSEKLPSNPARFAKGATVRDNGTLPTGRWGQRAKTEQAMLGAQTKFEVGQIVVTPAASAALEADGQHLADLLAKHQSGDWGQVSDQVRGINERGLVEQFNLQSVYVVPSGQRLVVVTNRDRTVTMVHLDPTVS
jgi:hypothetical protein